MNDGWISLHRKIQEHWLFTEERKFSKFEAWIDLLLLMNHKDGKAMFKNEVVEVKRGQHVTSIRKLCARWGWSNNKVKKFLSLLESENMIIVQSDSKKTLITLVNYDFYQSDDLKKRHTRIENDTETHQKSDAEDTPQIQVYQGVSEFDEEKKRRTRNADATQMHTNNNDNNSFNNNNDDFWANIDNMDLTPEQQLEIEVEEYYQAKRRKHNWPATTKDRNWIKKAIEEGFTREEMIAGITKAFLDAGEVNSFEYCLKVMRTQRREREKWNRMKKEKGRNHETKDKLPTVLQPEFQQQHQNELSPEESEARINALRERINGTMRRLNERMPKVGEH